MTNPDDGMQISGFDLLSRLGHGDSLHKEARADIERQNRIHQADERIIQQQETEIERRRGEAEVADEQLAQLRGFAEAHKNCVALDELTAVRAEIDRLNKKCSALALLHYGSPAEPSDGYSQEYADGLRSALCRIVIKSIELKCPDITAMANDALQGRAEKSEVRHCTNCLTYPGGQSVCTREAGHSGSCLF